MSSESRSGLTLIELLLVIGIVAVLSMIVIIMMNPSTGLPENRDLQRRHDITSILNAVYMYANDKGAPPDTIPSDFPGEICQYNKSCADIPGAVDLNMLVDFYIEAIPMDPGMPVNNGTDYYIMRNSGGTIIVSAPEAEAADGEVSVSR